MLRAATANDPDLSEFLETRLYPKRSPEMDRLDAQDRLWKRRNSARERKQMKDRADWVRALQQDPDRVLRPHGLRPGGFSSDQYHLLLTLMSNSKSTRLESAAEWRALVPEFGEPVARAFRDAAIAHWRIYRPSLRSEGGDSGSTPYSLIFGLIGLAIEANEDTGFAQRLSTEEAHLAFRYITWELNGFPSWFEALYRAFPDIGREAVFNEIRWELQKKHSEQSKSNYILHDIFYHAMWLHREVGAFIFDWLNDHDVQSEELLSYCIDIVVAGGTTQESLAHLAASKATRNLLDAQRPRWFALWVDADPANAIPVLEGSLAALSPADGSSFAEQFLVALLGDRHGTGKRAAAYRNARDLKALYLLMHNYVRVADDIDRAGTGAYSPTVRDKAQEARNRLFSMLTEVPGPEAYAAIKALEREHPVSGYRSWMAAQARQRATQDADEPLWSVEQVREFAKAILGKSRSD